MNKIYLIIIWLALITGFIFWPFGSYHYLKLNSVVGQEPVVLFEKDFFSFGQQSEIVVTARSYVQDEGNGILAIELNGEVIDSGDTLVNPSPDIQSQTILRVRDTKLGKNKIRILSWVDNGEKFVITSLGVRIK